jgi:hypothetical protein
MDRANFIGQRGANVSAEIPADRVFDNRFIKQVEKELKGWAPQAPK